MFARMEWVRFGLAMQARATARPRPAQMLGDFHPLAPGSSSSSSSSWLTCGSEFESRV